MMVAPGSQHLLGTDQFGRDIFSRLVFGARTAMIVGFGAAVGGGLIGLVLGVTSRPISAAGSTSSCSASSTS